jgi:hypothetical protein
MAEKLRTFDFGRASTLTRSEKAIYPWSEWLDGDIWQLTFGEDFNTPPLMMERIIRTRATGRGAKVRLRHLPLGDDDFGIIVLQRHDIKGPNELKKEEVRSKRAAKKAEAEKAAAETLAKAGIKTPAKAANGTPAKKVPAKTAKAVSKRPSKRPVKRVATAA